MDTLKIWFAFGHKLAVTCTNALSYMTLDQRGGRECMCWG